jgi:hypothetical protein
MAIQYAQVEYASLECSHTGRRYENYVKSRIDKQGFLGWWIVGKMQRT